MEQEELLIKVFFFEWKVLLAQKEVKAASLVMDRADSMFRHKAYILWHRKRISLHKWVTKRDVAIKGLEMYQPNISKLLTETFNAIH